MTPSPRAPPYKTVPNVHSLLAGCQKGVSVSPLHGHATLASQGAMNVWASFGPRPERSRVPKWAQMGSQRGPQEGSQEGSFRRFFVFYASYTPQRVP